MKENDNSMKKKKYYVKVPTSPLNIRVFALWSHNG